MILFSSTVCKTNNEERKLCVEQQRTQCEIIEYVQENDQLEKELCVSSFVYKSIYQQHQLVRLVPFLCKHFFISIVFFSACFLLLLQMNNSINIFNLNWNKEKLKIKYKRCLLVILPLHFQPEQSKNSQILLTKLEETAMCCIFGWILWYRSINLLHVVEKNPFHQQFIQTFYYFSEVADTPKYFNIFCYLIDPKRLFRNASSSGFSWILWIQQIWLRNALISFVVHQNTLPKWIAVLRNV